MFAPSLMLGFTETRSKVSAAVVIAALYVAPRLTVKSSLTVFDPSFLILGSLAGFSLIQGLALAYSSSQFIILLLQGQWITYLLAGYFLAYDIGIRNGGLAFLSASLVALSAIAALFGIMSVWTGPIYDYQHHTHARWGLHVERAVGTFESPGMLAVLLAIGLLIYFFSPHSQSRVARAFYILTFSTGLILTQAKAGILACLFLMFAGSCVSACVRAFDFRSALSKSTWVIILFCAVGAVAAMYAIDIEALLRQDTTTRGEIQAQVLEAYLSDSFLAQVLGIGFRQSATISREGMWFTAHNSYVSLLREIGIVGIALVGAFFLQTAVRLWKLRRLEWLYAFCALALVSSSESYLYSAYFVPFLGAAAGLAAAQYRRSTCRASIW